MCAVPDPNAIHFRPMFGGVMAYANGKPFASLSNVGLAIKLDAAHYAALLQERGARPLQYEPSSPPSKQYVLVPDALLNDSERERLGVWLAHAIRYVSQPGKPKRNDDFPAAACSPGHARSHFGAGARRPDGNTGALPAMATARGVAPASQNRRPG